MAEQFDQYRKAVQRVAVVREATIARLTRENEAMRKALKVVIGLQPYINNPSAWDHFDDEMSERLGTIVDGALASLKEPTDAQA